MFGLGEGRGLNLKILKVFYLWSILNLMHFRFLLLSIFFIGTVQFASAQDQGGLELKSGTLLDTVKCKSDPSQSYALYLPSTWSPKYEYAILYFFEPVARGKLPVEKYRDLADSHNLILVGSHNSRNGSWELCFEAADAMFEDTWARLKIDSNQVYAAGFSGGARVATAIAMETGKFNGVIGCGAGFPDMPNYQPGAKRSFPFTGIVGRLDMNWMEMHDTRDQLDGLAIPNRLILHAGPHEWPEPEMMAQALDFFYQLYWQEQEIWRGEELAGKRQGERIMFAREQEAKGEYYLAHAMWENLMADFAWLGDRSVGEGLTQDGANPSPMPEIAAYLQEEKFTEAIAAEAQAMEEEREQQKEIRKHYWFNLDNYRDSAEFAWWETKGKALTRMRNSKNKPAAAMAERLTRMVAARALETTVSRTDYPKTISLYKPWALVEPESIWPHYVLAVAYAGAEEDNLAMASLKKAVKNGLKKKTRLEDPPEFDRLRKKKKFQKLVDGLEE